VNRHGFNKHFCETLRRLVVLMALMGFSMQSLGTACMMMPNETSDPVETSLLTDQADCHGHSKQAAQSDTLKTDTLKTDTLKIDALKIEYVKERASVMSDDCCNGSCLMMNCQAVTAMDTGSVDSISAGTLQLVPAWQVAPTSTLISVLFRPPILS